MSKLPISHALFEYLDETHQQIQKHVQRLHTFVKKLEDENLTSSERKELHLICTFFETEARQHHLDEEKHVFPGLLASADEFIVQVAKRLKQDHGWLEENWLEMYPHLEAVSEGSGSYDYAELSHAMTIFQALYDEHMQLEEENAYPYAKKVSHTTDVLQAGREMAQRRYRATKIKHSA
jgi:hemerythrin-like domain-containing protein